MADQYQPAYQLNQTKPLTISDVWEQPTPAQMMEMAMMPQKMLAGRIQITNALAQAGMDPQQMNKLLGSQADPGLIQGTYETEQLARQTAITKQKTDFLKPFVDMLIEAGDNDGLQKLMSTYEADPHLGPLTKQLRNSDFKITGKRETESLGPMDKETLMRMAASADNPEVAEQMRNSEPGIYKVTYKGNKVTKFESKQEPASMDARRYRNIQKDLELKKTVTPEDVAWAHGYEKEQGLKGSVIVGGRKETMLETPMWAYDKNTGDVVNVTKGDMNKDPGRYSSPEMALKIKSKRAMFEEIEQSSQTLREIAPKIKWDTKALAQMAVALRTNDDGSAIRNFVQSSVGRTLTPDQMEYVNRIMNLRESAYALRGAGGAGMQSSDMLRRAIDNMVPSGSTFSKKDFDSKMKLFDMQVKALKKGIPGLGYGTNKETEQRAEKSKHKGFDAKIEKKKDDETIPEYLERTQK